MSTQVVYKYQIPETGHSIITVGEGIGFELDLPVGAKILHVAFQEDQGPQMWVMVDPDRSTERRKFQVVGTGHRELPKDGLEYVGTWHQPTSLMEFVFHVFELVAPEE